ncbi:MAG: hypothetical protein MHMPM18_003237 [Marteilia pararefringens]
MTFASFLLHLAFLLLQSPPLRCDDKEDEDDIGAKIRQCLTPVRSLMREDFSEIIDDYIRCHEDQILDGKRDFSPCRVISDDRLTLNSCTDVQADLRIVLAHIQCRFDPPRGERDYRRGLCHVNANFIRLFFGCDV